MESPRNPGRFTEPHRRPLRSSRPALRGRARHVQLDARGSELLFQILTEREEKASIAPASNLPFSEWGGVIPDPRLVAAIVDRVTFNAHIIETGTESFRLRSTRARRAKKAS
jgi:hypothetical protein